MAKKQVVLAVFSDEAAADAAVVSLKAWDKASDEVKLTSVGVLVLDDKGKVKTHKMGSRSTMKGAGIGLVLAFVAGPALLTGAVVGGVIGALHHKNLGIKSDEQARIAAALADGKAAVGVLVTPEEATLVSDKLTELGGAVETSDVPDEAAAALDEAAPAAEAEAATDAPAADAPAADAPAEA
jgi:uncharacterized membrane protein